MNGTPDFLGFLLWFFCLFVCFLLKVGLEKLDFAASQIAIMQDQITALEPELGNKADEIENLMVVIEADAVEVESKKEVKNYF